MDLDNGNVCVQTAGEFRCMKNIVIATFVLLVAGFLAYQAMGDSGGRQSTLAQAASTADEVSPGGGSRASLDEPSPNSREQVSAALPLAGEGYFAFRRGRRFLHGFKSSAESQMVFGDPPQNVEMKLAFSGQLEIVVVLAQEEELVLRLALSEVQYLVNDAPLQGSQEELAAAMEPFLGHSFVRMGRNGETLGYRFPNANGMSRNLVRSLWSVLHFVAPEEDADEWVVVDTDDKGPHQKRYSWIEAPQPSAPGKLRVRREPIDKDAAGPQTIGQGEALVSAELRWPTRVEYEEDADVQDSDLSAQQHGSFFFELIDQGSLPLASLEAFELEGEWSQVSGIGEVIPGSEAQPGAAKNLEGVTASALVQEILGLIAADMLSSRELYEAQLTLARLIAADPTQLEVLGELFAQAQLEGDAAVVVMAAVGMAGNEAAQEFLADHFGEAGGSEQVRVFALRAAMQLQEPNEALLQAMQASHSETENTEAVRMSALLALGVLAGRSDETASIEYLLAREGDSQESRDKAMWLEALGNSGSAEILPKLSSYLEHEDPGLRTSATQALRFIETPEANRLLAQAARDDASVEVRASAAEILAKRSVEVSDATISHVLANEPEVLVRRRAVQALGQRQPRGEFARGALTRVAAEDPNRDLRALAKQLLDG